MLDTFALQQGGTQYRRPVGAFQRIFGATSSSAPTRNVMISEPAGSPYFTTLRLRDRLSVD
jgi:hypothetical protein